MFFRLLLLPASLAVSTFRYTPSMTITEFSEFSTPVNLNIPLFSCFVEIYSKLYWTFSIPFAILLFFAIAINQFGITACNMQRLNVNERQLFWAK